MEDLAAHKLQVFENKVLRNIFILQSKEVRHLR
jgi:hypothetical protein